MSDVTLEKLAEIQRILADCTRVQVLWLVLKALCARFDDMDPRYLARLIGTIASDWADRAHAAQCAPIEQPAARRADKPRRKPRVRAAE